MATYLCVALTSRETPKEVALRVLARIRDRDAPIDRDEMMAEVDASGSGMVNFKEFAEMVMKPVRYS